MADIQLEPTCKFMAASAFLSTQPHPLGFVITDNVRLGRALWAYQWAAQHLAEWTSGGMVLEPSRNDLYAAMREWEQARG
ncbi:hypothetical protein [Nocardia rhizosphaerae]|uniref:Uncharacterized protein n=1 Tax=Nocardia rhizosphaerae TaxID=1691571 RepID=A0ABV8L2F4_9NOCA